MGKVHVLVLRPLVSAALGRSIGLLESWCDNVFSLFAGATHRPLLRTFSKVLFLEILWHVYQCFFLNVCLSLYIMCVPRASGTGVTGGCRAESSRQPLIIFVYVWRCIQVAKEDRRGYRVPRWRSYTQLWAARLWNQSQIDHWGNVSSVCPAHWLPESHAMAR